MSFPSGSILLVTLQNGASPNTGPFNIYINNTSSSNLITSNVSKNTLSSSGYTFVTPLETFSVLATSTGSITNTDIVVLGNVPGLTKYFGMSGSYDSVLNVGQETASIFYDPGYGLFTIGQINTYLANCSMGGVGNTNISPDRNTLITVKTNESSSNYIKFYPGNSTSSVYYYHVPCVSSSATNETNLNICVDLSGGNFQTVATSSINVYPVTTGSLTMNRPANFINSAPYGNDNTSLLIRVNGNLIYSGSSVVTGIPLYFPGNALVEITSSIGQSSLYGSNDVVGNFVTNSLAVNLTTADTIYYNQIVFNQTSTVVFSGSTGNNQVTCSFIALPGAQYSITANQYGSLIYGYIFDSAGSAFISKTAACGASTGGPTYYSFYAGPSINNTIFYTNIGMTSTLTGANAWYAARKSSSPTRTPVFINNSGLVTDFQGPC
jgi:hypothetical protein